MANEHGPDKPGPRHEQTDVNVFAIGRFAFALVAVVAVCLFLLFGFFRFLVGITGGERPAVSDYSRNGQLPPQPRLEERPAVELKAFRDAEDQALSSYGWVDQKNGVVHIPIDRAIDLLAQRGLPSRPQTGPQTAASDVSVPTESGLGPKMQQPGGPLAGAGEGK
jgi:hypothetical protein